MTHFLFLTIDLSKSLKKPIQDVQKQFLLFCLSYLNWGPAESLSSYKSKLNLINLPSLESRRSIINVLFVSKLFNGFIHCFMLLEKLKKNDCFKDFYENGFKSILSSLPINKQEGVLNFIMDKCLSATPSIDDIFKDDAIKMDEK